MVDIQRLLREFTPGTHVRASLEIFDASSGTVIPEGTAGIVVRKNRDRPRYVIRWSTGDVVGVTADCIDPEA